MNDPLCKQVLIFNACFVFFMQDKKHIQKFEFEHTFLYKLDGKKTDQKDCVGDKYAFSFRNHVVSTPPLCSEQSMRTENLW